jgi:hypothetical protein
MLRSIQAAAFTAALSGVIAGCSPTNDPATQEPVELTPGLYKIIISSAGMAKFIQQGPGETTGEICVRPDDVAGFPDKVAQSVYPNPYCAASPELREGNAFRGTLTCPVDPKLATGKTTIDYEGVVFADRVVATRRMKIDSRPVPGTLSPEEQRQLAVGTALMNSFGNQITAVRTGDCG